MLEIGKKIGIIGGGQLARMLALSAYNLGYKVAIYSDNADSSAAQISKYVSVGGYNDKDKLLKFASEIDILTYEFENIDQKILSEIELKFPHKLFPDSKALYISNNRIREKDFFTSLSIDTPLYKKINSFDDCLDFPLPAILKTVSEGYDGKGQYRINNIDDLKKIDFTNGEYIIEQVINFQKEVSVVLARDKNGEIRFFPIPENNHVHGILHSSFVPNSLSFELNQQICEIGKKIADSLNYIGVMAIEFFICNEKIIANEIAPRVHNSGHYTMNACNVSQFEQHIRAIAGLSLRTPELISSCKMRNLVGDELKYYEDFIKLDNANIHMYDKGDIRLGRKMGHVNITQSFYQYE